MGVFFFFRRTILTKKYPETRQPRRIRAAVPAIKKRHIWNGGHQIAKCLCPPIFGFVRSWKMARVMTHKSLVVINAKAARCFADFVSESGLRCHVTERVCARLRHRECFVSFVFASRHLRSTICIQLLISLSKSPVRLSVFLSAWCTHTHTHTHTHTQTHTQTHTHTHMHTQ